MRLAILADVHGNLPALEAVLADLPPVDDIVVAGDVTGLLYQDETVQRLRGLGCQMIQGNGEIGLLNYHDGQAPAACYNNQQFAMLRWSHRNIRPETLDFLRTLPQQLVLELPGASAIRIVHGSPRDPAESVFPRRAPETLDAALAMTREAVLVCAHTHQPWVLQRDHRLALNPGSVCGPLNGFVGAQYALLHWQDGRWQAELRAIAYDLDPVRRAFRETGLLQEGGPLARAVLHCIETGHDHALDFLRQARRAAAGAGLPNDHAIPDDIWEQTAAAFPWTGRD